MKYFIFLSVLILNSINTNAGEVPSVKEYKEHRDSAKYDQFIYGLDNGLEWASDQAYRKYGHQIFCRPSGIDMPVNEIKKMINKQLERDSAFYSKYEDAPLIGLALKNAYIRNFPCTGDMEGRQN